MDNIEKAKIEMLRGNLTQAHELLEWATLENPADPIPYILRSTIYAELHWQERRMFETLSGKLFGSVIGEE